MKLRTKIDLFLLTFILVAGFISISNAQNIGDWWHFRNYRPNPHIASLAERSGMNDTGERLFYRFNPEMVTPEEMAEKCEVVRLGCIEGNAIYLLEADSPRGNYSTVVTAAHEMLHVAYERMTENEKNALHKLIDDYINQSDDSDLLDKLQTYPADEYYNEAHSFLGSETGNLPGELEEHYRKYFSNRQKTINAYKKSPESR